MICKFNTPAPLAHVCQQFRQLNLDPSNFPLPPPFKPQRRPKSKSPTRHTIPITPPSTQKTDSRCWRAPAFADFIKGLASTPEIVQNASNLVPQLLNQLVEKNYQDSCSFLCDCCDDQVSGGIYYGHKSSSYINEHIIYAIHVLVMTCALNASTK